MPNHQTKARTLYDYRSYLDWVSLSVHDVPAPSDQEFLSLGYLAPGAPPEPTPVPPAGIRQLYAYRDEVPTHIWERLHARLYRRGPRGISRPPDRMYGIPGGITD